MKTEASRVQKLLTQQEQEIERLNTQVDFERRLRIEAFDELRAQDDKIERLQAALRCAAGYISTTDGYTDRHPQDVYDWLIRAALKEQDK